MGGTLVVAELADGHVRKSTFSAIAFAKQVGGPFAVVAVGAGAANAAKELTGFGAQKVLVVDDAGDKNYVCERFAPTVAKVAKDGGWDTVVVTASAFGKDLAPRLAANSTPVTRRTSTRSRSTGASACIAGPRTRAMRSRGWRS
jgi:electron transfer flavoprotein alpha subunit